MDLHMVELDFFQISMNLGEVPEMRCNMVSAHNLLMQLLPVTKHSVASAILQKVFH